MLKGHVHWRRVLAIAVGTSLGLCAMSRPCEAENRIWVEASPRMAHAPADLVVRVRIEPHPDNRAYTVYVVPVGLGDEMSHGRSLDGANEPRTQEPWFVNGLSAGRYEIIGVLETTRGKHYSVPVTVQVMGPPDMQEGA